MSISRDPALSAFLLANFKVTEANRSVQTGTRFSYQNKARPLKKETVVVESWWGPAPLPAQPRVSVVGSLQKLPGLPRLLQSPPSSVRLRTLDPDHSEERRAPLSQGDTLALLVMARTLTAVRWPVRPQSESLQVH